MTDSLLLYFFDVFLPPPQSLVSSHSQLLVISRDAFSSHLGGLHATHFCALSVSLSLSLSLCLSLPAGVFSYPDLCPPTPNTLFQPQLLRMWLTVWSVRPLRGVKTHSWSHLVSFQVIMKWIDKSICTKPNLLMKNQYWLPFIGLIIKYQYYFPSQSALWIELYMILSLCGLIKSGHIHQIRKKKNRWP